MYVCMYVCMYVSGKSVGGLSFGFLGGQFAAISGGVHSTRWDDAL